MATLIDLLIKTKIEIDDMWVIARPIKDPFLIRLVDAWFVITGKYDAVYFYKQE